MEFNSLILCIPLVRRILQVFAPAHTPPGPELKPSQQHVTLWLETARHSRKCPGFGGRWTWVGILTVIRSEASYLTPLRCSLLFSVMG